MNQTTEPTWLRERRKRGSRHELALPDQKQKGWEFTDLSSLDLASFSPALDGDLSVAADAARVPRSFSRSTQRRRASRISSASDSGRWSRLTTHLWR